ncbi:bifunctional ADP-dependent NAD(P)H-hydrate dehydratase/NAD(P)H-hydrate epimerase, partial [Klebsiella quasipneumoniae]|nr:bifunctional ADP-dependent NAD(P)H-hydrate dehydratase/NAD(P)H-hydrate epimerase [Klebsiella quasipneumoniae]
AVILLAFIPDKRLIRVVTPHPGVAARVLYISVAVIESDVLLSAQSLLYRYGGVVLLYVGGSLVASVRGAIGIIVGGN